MPGSRTVIGGFPTLSAWDKKYNSNVMREFTNKGRHASTVVCTFFSGSVRPLPLEAAAKDYHNISVNWNSSDKMFAPYY